MAAWRKSGILLHFKVDGSMEKKWDTVNPADLKRLFVRGTYMSRWSRKGEMPARQ
jgi:hypothetical protein